jgi:chromosome segregation ATPase
MGGSCSCPQCPPLPTCDICIQGLIADETDLEHLKTIKTGLKTCELKLKSIKEDQVKARDAYPSINKQTEVLNKQLKTLLKQLLKEGKIEFNDVKTILDSVDAITDGIEDELTSLKTAQNKLQLDLVRINTEIGVTRRKLNTQSGTIEENKAMLEKTKDCDNIVKVYKTTKTAYDQYERQLKEVDEKIRVVKAEIKKRSQEKTACSANINAITSKTNHARKELAMYAKKTAELEIMKAQSIKIAENNHNKTCPDGWKSLSDGRCKMVGNINKSKRNPPCEDVSNFRGYSDSGKADWARQCKVKWTAVGITN